MLRAFVLVIAAAVFLSCCSAQVATEDMYGGIFTGFARGDRGSSALLTLNLTQNGTAVTGYATVLPGLVIDTGGFFCPGAVSVPEGTVAVEGVTSSSNPRQLKATTSFSTGRMNITADIQAELAIDGSNMNVKMKLKIPWPCRSPIVTANLNRAR